MKRHDVIDEDGNEIAPPSPDTDAGQLIYLLEYARLRGFRIGPTVQVGNIVVQVRDLRQVNESATTAQPELDIWEEHGHRDQ